MSFRNSSCFGVDAWQIEDFSKVWSELASSHSSSGTKTVKAALSVASARKPQDEDQDVGLKRTPGKRSTSTGTMPVDAACKDATKVRQLNMEGCASGRSLESTGPE